MERQEQNGIGDAQQEQDSDFRRPSSSIRENFISLAPHGAGRDCRCAALRSGSDEL